MEALTTDRDICQQNFEAGAQENQQLEEQYQAALDCLGEIARTDRERWHDPRGLAQRFLPEPLASAPAGRSDGTAEAEALTDEERFGPSEYTP